MDSFILASSRPIPLQRFAEAWRTLGITVIDGDDVDQQQVTVQSPSGSHIYLQGFAVGGAGDIAEEHNEVFALIESPHFYCMDYNDRSFAFSALKLLMPVEPTLVVEDDVSNMTKPIERFLSKVH